MMLTPDELYDLTPRSFENKKKGWVLQQDLITRNQWEQTRLLGSWIYNASGNLKKPIKPKQLLNFEWDIKELKGKAPTLEDIQHLANKKKLLNTNSEDKFNKIFKLVSKD